MEKKMRNMMYPIALTFIVSGCSHKPKTVYTTHTGAQPIRSSQLLGTLVENLDAHIIASESHKQRAELSLEINQNVEKWLKFFAERNPDTYARYMERGEPIRGYIENTLQRYGVPKEMFFLAMIESGFTNHAVSSAGAVGPWQFMPATGRRYGLTVDSYLDERRDPIRATEAAAKYLADLHNVFQNWYLAMAAYNAGEGRIMGAIMRAGTRNFWELAKQKALPRETMDYVPKFLAAAIIGSDPKRFGFNFKSVDQLEAPELFEAPPRKGLKNIAEVTGVSFYQLKQLNPHLIRNVVPPQGSSYGIWIPAGTKRKFEAVASNIQKLPSTHIAATPVASSSAQHRVRKGETLSAISQKYGMSVAQLKSINNLRSDRILLGQRLSVQSRGSNVASNHQSQKVKYKVRRGDNLTTIAKKFNTTIHSIKKSNNLKRSNIYAGQILQIGF
jgi:membrane-bound lytic murein transglycosylase D